MEEGECEGRSGYLSEVHVGCPHLPEGNGATVTTRFAFFPPASFGRSVRSPRHLRRHARDEKQKEEEEEQEDEEDEDEDDDDDNDDDNGDGDLRVRRQRRRTDGQQCITIRHRMDTTLPDVGLQV